MCYQSQNDNSNIYFMRWLKPTIAISVCKHYIVKLVVPLSFFYTKIYLFLYLSKYNLNCTYFISLSIILSTLTQCNHFIISVRHQYCPKYPKNLQYGQCNMVQFYILSSTFKKKKIPVLVYWPIRYILPVRPVLTFLIGTPLNPKY